MIHFEGIRDFPLPPEAVFAKLGDAGFLVGCLKDAEEVTEKGPDRAVWKLQPGLSFVRTKLDITMDITDRSPVTRVNVKLFSRGIGATATVQAVLNIEPASSGSVVRWSADVSELTGLLKLVPKGLISSTAHKIIDDTWSEVGKQMAPVE